MKRKQITAILMSAILTVSACMPMNSISAMAAENAGAGATEVAAEAAAAQEPQQEPAAEPTQEPATEPTQEPAVEPTQEPAAEPTQEPAAEPAVEPTQPETTENGDTGAEDKKDDPSGTASTSDTASTDEPAADPDAADPAADQTAVDPVATNPDEAAPVEANPANEEATEEAQLVKPVKNAEYNDYDSAVDITADSSAVFSVTNESPYYFFRFIPAKTGRYRFYANGYIDTIELVDEYYHVLTYFYSSDDESSGIEYELRKGKTYYYIVSVYEEDTVTAYLETVSVHSLEVDGEEEQTVEVYCDPVTGPEQITLSVTAESENAITYAWYNMDMFEEDEEPVSTTSSYTFTPSYSDDRISCTISDGNETVHREFYMKLNHFMVEKNPDYPYDPIKAYAEYGQPAQLHVNVSADDTSRLNYSWSVGNYVEDDDYWDFDSAAGDNGQSTFQTEPITGHRMYRCYISDQYGNSDSIDYEVFVENNFKAYVITDPDNIDVDNTHAVINMLEGDEVTLKVGVQAADMTGITYRWDMTGENLEEENSNEVHLEYSDSWEGARECYCTVTDRYGTEIVCAFEFDITHPYVESHYWDGYVRIEPGETETLPAAVETNIEDLLSYIWYYDDEVIPGETGKTLTLDDTALSGVYKCKAYYKDWYGFFRTEVIRENNFRVRAKDSTDVKVASGAPAELEVVATADDTEGITYQWYIYNKEGDDTPIDGATSSKYTVPSVTSAAEYYCKVADKFNTRKSVWFNVNVDNNLSVHIAGEPVDTTAATIYVDPGETARLEVVAEANDTSGITYEWFRNDTYESETTQSGVYEFVPTRYTRVEVTVTDKYGNKADAEFYVYIDTGLTANPEAHTTGGNALPCERNGNDPEYVRYVVYVPAGEGVILNPNATVEQGNIRYAWQWDDRETWETMTSSADQLVIDACNERNSYTCTVRDDYDNCIDLVFEIVIDNQLVAYPEGAPGSDTRYIYAAPGSEVTLTTIATAADMDGISYSWNFYKNGDWQDRDLFAINDNSAVITVDGNYEVNCWVYDRYNNNKRVTFYVYPENHLIVYPENAGEMWNGSYSNYMPIDAEPGEVLDLRVIANADNMDHITYTWEKNAKVANNAGEYEYTSQTVSETTNTLHITADETNTYTCTVDDGFGSSKKVTFDVTVGGLIAYPEGAAEVDGMPSSRVAIVDSAGGTKTLRVITLAPENETITYKWTQGPLNDSGWWPLDADMESTTNELTVKLDTAKRYLCVVSDTHGNQALSYFYVNVGGVRLTSNFGTPALVGDNSYVVKVPVKVGEETTLQAIPVGSSSEGLTFRWLGDEFDTIPGATGNSYTFTGGVGTRYQCRVTDANGVVSKLTFELQTDNELSAKCAIVKDDGTTENYEYQGIVVNANVGDTVTLAMNVSCLNDNHLRYEWADNLGRQVGTAATCPVTVEGNGTYTGRVTDGYGNSVSVLFRVLTNGEALKDAVCTLSQTSYPFDGKPKRPEVTVVLNGRTLTPGVDYTVAYSKNVDPGTAAVIITGRTVEGTKYLFFTIGNMIQTPAADVDEIVVGVGYTKTFNIEGCHTPLSASGVNAAIATATISEQTVSVKGVMVGTYELALTAASNDVYNEAQVTSKSGNPTIIVKVVPAKTASVTAENANKGIKITWKKVTGATGYVIKRQAGSGEWKSIKTITSGSTLTYTDTYGNTNGTKYTYRVYAKAATGTSYLYRAAECYKVARPTISSVTNSASKKMTVKWAKNAKANGYQIQYSLKSNFSGAKSVPADKNSIVTKTIGGLTKGKKYYVRLRTYKKVGSKKYYSTWSPTKTVTIKK